MNEQAIKWATQYHAISSRTKFVLVCIAMTAKNGISEAGVADLSDMTNLEPEVVEKQLGRLSRLQLIEYDAQENIVLNMRRRVL